jgi:hypothetical protein
VLIFGRFTEGRVKIVDQLADGLRSRNYVPLSMNFDKPGTKDFTEVAAVLTRLSRFVIADVTNPRSMPLELQANLSVTGVPIAPIIEEGQAPFAMLNDLLVKHPEVLDVVNYSSVERLVEELDRAIIKPALARALKLQRQHP